MRYSNCLILEILFGDSFILVELLLREPNFAHTHTQSTLAVMYNFSSPKLLSFREKRFCIFECDDHSDLSWQIYLEIPHFLVELLLQERNFGHTHTQSTLAVM